MWRKLTKPTFNILYNILWDGACEEKTQNVKFLDDLHTDQFESIAAVWIRCSAACFWTESKNHLSLKLFLLAI